jgi:hypothetical protein
MKAIFHAPQKSRFADLTWHVTGGGRRAGGLAADCQLRRASQSTNGQLNENYASFYDFALCPFLMPVSYSQLPSWLRDTVTPGDNLYLQRTQREEDKGGNRFCELCCGTIKGIRNDRRGRHTCFFLSLQQFPRFVRFRNISVSRKHNLFPAKSHHRHLRPSSLFTAGGLQQCSINFQ